MQVSNGTNFYETKYIFIHVPDGTTRDHATLLAISPVYKTVEFLDSERGGHEKFRDDVLLKTLILLSTYLRRKFIAPEWRLRFGSSSQQGDNRNDCAVAVMANTMAVAFGYCFPYWFDFWNTDIDEDDYDFAFNGKPYKVKHLN
jgi:hypothetical protein